MLGQHHMSYFVMSLIHFSPLSLQRRIRSAFVATNFGQQTALSQNALSFSSGLGLCRAGVQLRVGTSLQNPCDAQCMQAIHVCNIPLRLGAVSSLCCDGHHVFLHGSTIQPERPHFCLIKGMECTSDRPAGVATSS